jgi:hypothetical protein
MFSFSFIDFFKLQLTLDDDNIITFDFLTYMYTPTHLASCASIARSWWLSFSDNMCFCC